MVAGHTTCHMRRALSHCGIGLIDLRNKTNGQGLELRNESSDKRQSTAEVIA